MLFYFNNCVELELVCFNTTINLSYVAMSGDIEFPRFGSAALAANKIFYRSQFRPYGLEYLK